MTGPAIQIGESPVSRNSFDLRRFELLRPPDSTLIENIFHGTLIWECRRKVSAAF